MQVVVRLPSVLRSHSGGAAAIQVEISEPEVTVGAVLDALESLHPGIGRRIRDERGVQRRHVNLFLGRGDDFRRVDAACRVSPGAELVVLPAVSGGGGGCRDERATASTG